MLKKWCKQKIILNLCHFYSTLFIRKQIDKFYLISQVFTTICITLNTTHDEWSANGEDVVRTASWWNVVTSKKSTNSNFGVLIKF